MPLPNFLVIGVTKSGTTSLHYYLQQHPEIYLTQTKETNFFSFYGESTEFVGPGDREAMAEHAMADISDYKDQFSAVKEEKAIGEVSSSYLYYPNAAENIKKHVPEAKLIVILRDPVDRAYSSYMHLIREGHESIADFEESLKHEDDRIKKNWRYMWHYTQIGLYFEQIKRYMALFDSSQIRIYIYEEDYQKQPQVMFKDIFQFLEVDEHFLPDMTKKYNVTGQPRSKSLWSLSTKPNVLKKVIKPLLPRKFRSRLREKGAKYILSKPALDVEIRYRLIEHFRNDILKTQDLIKRDLTKWLN